MAKKILHFLCTSSFSGAENVACQIISICSDENTDFVYSSLDGTIRDALSERNVKFAPMNSVSVAEFKRVIREVKPDVIHAHDMKASLFASLACKNIPLISHIHNNNFDSRGISLKSILFYIAAKIAKHIFWVSDSAFEGYAFSKKLKDKSSVLYNIIDTANLRKKVSADSNSYNYDIVFLGRLTFPKNPNRLIDVLEKVVEKRPSAKMAIVGSGELDSDVREYTRKKGLDKNVDFLGFNPNPYKILSDSKLMLMTSRFEGLPMCAVEAAALGVPVVSTPTDGLKNLIKDGVNGFLSDDDDVLADDILKIISDDSLRNCFSKNQSEMSERYNDKDNYKKEIVNVYNKYSGEDL